MNLQVFKLQVKCLVKLVGIFKYTVSVMAPDGWQKEYLRTMCKSIVNLQRAILQVDTYKPFLRFLLAGEYKFAKDALSYDAYMAFRKSVAQYDATLNDTFLFVE